jgi:hypothetical protein
MVVAVRGMPGVGKTTLVAEYLARFQADYDLVWWISATGPTAVRDRIAAMADPLRLSGDAATRRARRGGAEDTVERVLDALRRGDPYRRWLIVLDGVDSTDDYLEFFPGSHGSILLTSRNRAASEVAEAIDLDVFRREDSLDFLGRQGFTGTEADQMADLYGDLPLALEQAVQWLAETGMQVSDYLTAAAARPGEVLAEGAAGPSQVPIAVSISTCLEDLAARAPAALDLLETCAVLGRAPVPYWLVNARPLPGVGQDGAASPETALRTGRAIQALGRFSLVTLDRPDGGVILPAVVRGLVRGRLTADRLRRARRDARFAMAASAPDDPDVGLSVRRYQRLSEHVMAFGPEDDPTPEGLGLDLRTGRWLAHRGDLGEARDLLNWTVEAWRRRVGDDHPATLAARLHRAGQGRLSGWTAAGREELADIVARCQRMVAPEHPLALHARATDLVARRYLAEEDRQDGPGSRPRAAVARGLREVLASVRAAASADTDAAGPAGPTGPGGPAGNGSAGAAAGPAGAAAEVAVMVSLVNSLLSAGEDEEALELARSAEEIAVGSLGPAHLVWCAAATALANSLAARGDHAGARERDETTIRECRQVFGDDHLFVVVAAANLAAGAAAAGDPASAILRGDSLTRLVGRFSGGHRWSVSVERGERLSLDVDLPIGFALPDAAAFPR